jgi:general secretion pathway protein J
MAFTQSDSVTSKQRESEVFLGNAQSIRYVGPMPGYLGFGGPQVQQLGIAQGDNGLELVLQHALVQGFEESMLDERDPIVLIDHIALAEFQFLGRNERGELMPWTNAWEDPGQLPAAISLDIEFEAGAYAQWPLLVAAVKIDPSAIEVSAGGKSYRSAIQDLIQRRRTRN